MKIDSIKAANSEILAQKAAKAKKSLFTSMYPCHRCGGTKRRVWRRTRPDGSIDPRMNNLCEDGFICWPCERKRNDTRAVMVSPLGVKLLCRPATQAKKILAGWTFKKPTVVQARLKQRVLKKIINGAILDAQRAASRKQSQMNTKGKNRTINRKGRPLLSDLLDSKGKVQSWFESLWDSALVCQRSGLPFGDGYAQKSIDRINSALGTIQGNVQIVRLQYNWAKNKHDDATVEELAVGIWKTMHPNCTC